MVCKVSREDVENGRQDLGPVITHPKLLWYIARMREMLDIQYEVNGIWEHKKYWELLDKAIKDVKNPMWKPRYRN